LPTMLNAPSRSAFNGQGMELRRVA
jgi:hypothetical protein